MTSDVREIAERLNNYDRYKGLPLHYSEIVILILSK